MVVLSLFYLSHELQKQHEFDNYYIYCVLEQQEHKQIIYRLRRPDLHNRELFKVEPVNYIVSFN
jgi:hypothetical protein